MAKFSEMPAGTRLLVLLLLGAMVGTGYYFLYFSGKNQENQELDRKLKDKKAENERLKEFVPKLAQLNRDMAILEQQIEREKKVVPEDKDADQFIRILHDTAATSGIEIRRYTAMPIANHEFYSDVPFSIDIDGPYYSVLNFFQRVGELERIVNIDNLQLASTKNTNAAKVKGTYPYTPGETIVASCTATTFFSREPDANPPAAATGAQRPGQPGQPGAAAAPSAPAAPAVKK
ncbi:MAG TPA: type 4a pilus biogenesis protein PilO [Candidatus Angelobacter sp.]|nr:type 4a pilus biogenesis protein PilO [Candidatus Angelobacter sp.]